MDSRTSLLEFDPKVGEGLQMAASTLDGLMQGPWKHHKVLQLLGQGMSLADIFRFTEEQLHAVFQHASQLLERGDIPGSRQLFMLLTQLQPLEERYTYGLATTYQVDGDFRTAGRLYVGYLALNAECVHGRLRLAECLLAEGEPENAVDMFQSVVEDEQVAKNFPELHAYAQDMHDRCERLNADTEH